MWIDQFFAKVLRPFQFAILKSEQFTKNSAGSLTELFQANSENRRLKTQLQAQALELQLMEELRLENQRMRVLLGFKEAQKNSFLPVKVIATDPSALFRTIIIDRGESNGVRPSMPVINTNGVVGRVFEVGLWSSRVLMISDVNSRIDAIVQRSRARVIVAGTLGGGLGLRFLPRRQDIQEGDLLVSSGLGGLFPAGYPIGKITSRRKNPNDVLEDAEVEPLVDFNRLEELFIVTNFENQKG